MGNCYGRHYTMTMLLNIETTSGLSVLKHGVTSLHKVTSCDKPLLCMVYFCNFETRNFT